MATNIHYLHEATPETTGPTRLYTTPNTLLRTWPTAPYGREKLARRLYRSSQRLLRFIQITSGLITGYCQSNRRAHWILCTTLTSAFTRPFQLFRRPRISRCEGTLQHRPIQRATTTQTYVYSYLLSKSLGRFRRVQTAVRNPCAREYESVKLTQKIKIAVRTHLPVFY